MALRGPKFNENDLLLLYRACLILNAQLIIKMT
jgi:hypothetical protein